MLMVSYHLVNDTVVPMLSNIRHTGRSVTFCVQPLARLHGGFSGPGDGASWGRRGRRAPEELLEELQGGLGDPEPEQQAMRQGRREGLALSSRCVPLRWTEVAAWPAAAIDTTTSAGKLIFGIFAALEELERELITERTRAGLLAARARGHAGGQPYTMTPAMLRLAMAAMGKPETTVAALRAELGVSRQTLYRHVSPEGALRPDGEKLLARKR
jgi:hypothetical protein